MVIFCKSLRSAGRTPEKLLPFIERKLFLKVNREKTKVAYMRDIKFLSCAFGRSKGKCRYYIHRDRISRMKGRIRELTGRSNGWGYGYRKERLTRYIRGWLNCFKLAGLRKRIREWDGWLRRRIRMCIRKSRKRVRTRCRNLKKPVPDENRVGMPACCRKMYRRMAAHPAIHEALSDERLLRAGCPTFKMYYHPVFKG
jgi:hypothetical protein